MARKRITTNGAMLQTIRDNGQPAVAESIAEIQLIVQCMATDIALCGAKDVKKDVAAIRTLLDVIERRPVADRL